MNESSFKEVAMNTGIARATMEPSIKERAESIFKELGLSASTSIELFYRQVIAHDGLPFSVRLSKSNMATKNAFQEAKNGESERFENWDDFEKDFKS